MVGINLVSYKGDCYAPTEDTSIAKILFNSVISTKNARFVSLDLKDFCPMTPIPEHEYLWLSYDIIPEEITKKYKLDELVHNCKIHAEIRTKMHGLLQAGILAYQNLKNH